MFLWWFTQNDDRLHLEGLLTWSRKNWGGHRVIMAHKVYGQTCTLLKLTVAVINNTLHFKCKMQLLLMT